MDKIVDEYQSAISVITEIELLCYKSATDDDLVLLKNFIANSIVFPLDQDVKMKAIEIRKQFKLKLPDAIIAATAIVSNLVLITRNVQDFNKITGLEIVDPFSLR